MYRIAQNEDFLPTVEAADAPDVKVPQEGIPSQVQVVRYGLQSQSGKEEINLLDNNTEKCQTQSKSNIVEPHSS